MWDKRKVESRREIWKESGDKNSEGDRRRDILNKSKLSRLNTLISQSADSTLSLLALKTA